MDSVSEEKKPQVDVRKVLSSIWQCKWLYVKVLSIVFVLSCVYILPIPRTYTCQVMLAPEVSGAEAGGSLSSLASSFGVNLGAAMSQDAIFPALYPDLMASTDFILSLFPVPVVTEDGEVATNYCDYMRLHQKSSIWSYPLIWLGKLIALLTEDGEKQAFSGTDKLDAFRLTKEQQDVVGAISGNINCSVDKKTDVITITVTDQDPLVCATIADTLSARLQDYITAYRTSKARIDMKYYQGLAEKAKADYENALDAYGKYADAHTNVTLESYRLRLTDLENDMQLKFNTYSTLNTQFQAAKAKVQERTPAFTTLQGATVPIRPTAPKRVYFVLGMLCFAFAATSVYVLNKIVKG